MTTMTMVWIQNHAREVRNANKAVLSYLAFRSHYDNGLGAWPAVETIADACGISVRTVQRALEWLMENGWIELGQQDFSCFNPKTGKPIRRDRRTVVWNVICKDAPMPSDPTEAVEENVPPSDVVSGALARVEEHASDKMSPRENVGIPMEEHASDKMSPRAGENIGAVADTTGASDKMSRKHDKMSPNIQGYTNPSVPTGHLPASGESSRADGAETETGNVPTDVGSGPAAPVPAPDGPDLPGEVLDALGLMRSRLGLPVERPTGRDRRHAGRLVKRVAEANHGDTVKAMMLILAVIDWMPSHPFWLRRVTNGRSLDANWTAAATDYAVDQIEKARTDTADARDRDKPARPSKATPTPRAYTPEPHPNRLVAPIFGLRTMASAKILQADIDAHFAGSADTDECPVCLHDPRNQANHGVTRKGDGL